MSSLQVFMEPVKHVNKSLFSTFDFKWVRGIQSARGKVEICEVLNLPLHTFAGAPALGATEPRKKPRTHLVLSLTQGLLKLTDLFWWCDCVILSTKNLNWPFDLCGFGGHG